MVHLCRFVAAVAASPAHHGGVRSQLAIKHLVPPDDVTAMTFNELLHARHHIALQIILGRMFVIAFNSKLFDLRLAFRAFNPAVARHLVASDVDVLAREDVHHLKQHILKELQSLLIACTYHIFRHSPLLPDLVRTARAAQLRIRCESRQHVSRQINLRNDGDMTVFGIFYKVSQLLLGVKTSMTDGVERHGLPDDGP